MVREFDGYWALILGGSSGLGYASALKLASHGMNICIVHRNTRNEMPAVQARFEQILAESVDLLTYNVDAMDTEKQSSLLAELKTRMQGSRGLRCMVHSIAKGNLKPMLDDTSEITANPELTLEDLQLTMNNMAFSLYTWVKALYTSGLFASDARVLAFTSEGSEKVMKYYAAVSAAKAALQAIVRNIAIEFASEGIRANCIQAGATDTEALRKIPGSEQLINYTIARNPYRRLTTAPDIAGMVYLLCRDEARWINGTIVTADGGERLR